MYSDVPRSSPRWHFVWIRKAQESVSLPSCVLRLLALPYSKSDGNTEARACTYTIVVHRNYSSRIKHGNDYATYLRASIVAHSLTLDMKFCENFRLSRISADKRFQKNVCRPTHFARDRASAVRSASQSYTLFCI